MPDDLDALREEVREIRVQLNELQTEVSKIRRALGRLCLIVDDSPHAEGPKLKGIRPNSPDAFYMPATFCLDLARKMEYIYLAMREFAEATDREFAQRLLRDNGEVYTSGATWETAARATEEVLLGLLKEIRAEHRRLLERLAK